MAEKSFDPIESRFSETYPWTYAEFVETHGEIVVSSIPAKADPQTEVEPQAAYSSSSKSGGATPAVRASPADQS